MLFDIVCIGGYKTNKNKKGMVWKIIRKREGVKREEKFGKKAPEREKKKKRKIRAWQR